MNENQSYGRLLAASIRQGDGLFAPGTRTSYPNYRMPGYPYFVAGVGAVSGASATDWVAVEQSTILAQVFATSLAVLAIALALDRSLPRVTTLAVGLVLACLPSFVHRTQADALIFALGLLIAAAVLCRLDAERKGDATVGGAVLVHLAFAASFAVRSDVLIGWCVASLILHWRDRRLLVIPAVLLAIIGGTYGLVKGSHGYDGGPSTDNLGHVAFVGLWQVGAHPRPWVSLGADGPELRHFGRRARPPVRGGGGQPLRHRGGAALLCHLSRLHGLPCPSQISGLLHDPGRQS